jgi:hypothetical protein
MPEVDEDALREVIRFGVFAADHWIFRHMNDHTTEAVRTRCIVETAIRHCVEQGMLAAPTREQIDAAYAAGEFGMLPMHRDETVIPEPPPGTIRVD